MSDDAVFEWGQFVWFWPKLEEAPIVARVINRKGSGYHVAWASIGGNLYDYVADPDELFAVAACPEGTLSNPLRPPEAHMPPAPELREPPAPPVSHGKRRGK